MTLMGRGKATPDAPFPRWLRAARKRSGMSQSQLASQAGLTVDAVQNLEQGRRPDPRLSTAAALARAMGISLDDLTGFRP